MDEHEENFKDIFRYTDVEYTPDGYTDVYRWDDFLVIAGDHVYSAMDTIDSVSPGGEYEGFDPQYAYTCEIVGCGDLFDGCALFRPVSHDGEDYIQIAFLRSDIDDSTGEYTERFEAGSFDMPAADALRFDLAVDLMDYFSGRTFEGEPGVSRGLEPREAVAAVEGATGCDLNFFEDFWLGSPGEIVESVHVGPYTKQSLLDFSYYAKELSRRYGFADSDILEIARHLPEECPDRFAAVKAYLDCEYVPDGDAPDEKTYRWGDFLEIAGGDARYAAMLVDRTAAGEPEEGLHPETLVDQDIRDGEAFMLAGRPIAPEDAYDLPGSWTRTSPKSPIGPPPGRPAAPTAFSHAMSISTASTRSAPGTRTGCAPTATRWGSAGTTARSTTSRASPSSRWSGSCARTGTISPSYSTGSALSRLSTARPYTCRCPSRSTARRCGPAATTSAGARPSHPISAARGGTSPTRPWPPGLPRGA